VKKLQLKIPPPIILATTGALMWGIDLLLPQQLFIGSAYSILTTLAIALGLIIDLSSLVHFFAIKTTPNPLSPHKTKHLVVTGWYRFSRNPMYLGMLFLLIGWGLTLGNSFALMLIPAFVFLLTNLQIKPEEAVLRELFDDEFEQYCQRVRRWI
jgi:protein-S-isoprenylcysteine O-methyltransferase Ste14